MSIFQQAHTFFFGTTFVCDYILANEAGTTAHKNEIRSLRNFLSTHFAMEVL